VRIREASASELLMRCRNELDDVKTGGLTDLQDKLKGDHAYCLGGIRHKGSANLIQALVWNVGTCRSDDKGEIQMEETIRMRVPMRGTGTEQSVVGRKVL
jgi:hypothetical protein